MLPTFLRLDLSPSLSLFTDRSPPNLEFVICPPTTAVALLLKDFERGKSWIFASLCARVMPVAIYISKSYSRNPLSMTSSFILATFMCQLVRSAHRHTDFFLKKFWCTINQLEEDLFRARSMVYEGDAASLLPAKPNGQYLSVILDERRQAPYIYCSLAFLSWLQYLSSWGYLGIVYQFCREVI